MIATKTCTRKGVARRATTIALAMRVTTAAKTSTRKRTERVQAGERR